MNEEYEQIDITYRPPDRGYIKKNVRNESKKYTALWNVCIGIDGHICDKINGFTFYVPIFNRWFSSRGSVLTVVVSRVSAPCVCGWSAGGKRMRWSIMFLFCCLKYTPSIKQPDFITFSARSHTVYMLHMHHSVHRVYAHFSFMITENQYWINYQSKVIYRNHLLQRLLLVAFHFPFSFHRNVMLAAIDLQIQK